MQHSAFAGPLTREHIVEWYRSARDRSRRLFEIPRPESYYDRPIRLRNPIVFYEGHLPAFSVNTLLKYALKQKGVNADYERLFERGIDPEDEGGVKSPTDMWPSRDKVKAYAAAADERIERALAENDVEESLVIIEHEFMHQETLLYMFHNMEYAKKREAPWTAVPHRRFESGGKPPHSEVPAGIASLGKDRTSFGWDNEFPAQEAEVDAFTIDTYPVTNREYLEYVNATGAEPPHFWLRKNGEWYWRGMFELTPLPPDWPVWVSQDEATAYAQWRGKRIPTEAEFHRAAFGTPSGEEREFPWGNELPDETRGNFGFRNWDPVPVDAHPAGASAWGVHDLIGNGWEWTSTHFDGFPGFEPMPAYPVYSVDFFDEQHFVLKGASPVTARELVRRTFRNWFRPNYPYVFAKFRCVS